MTPADKDGPAFGIDDLYAIDPDQLSTTFGHQDCSELCFEIDV